ncbi:MAG: phosphoribosylformylglycinamidine synthase, partial [Burkholderiales bacterium]
DCDFLRRGNAEMQRRAQKAIERHTPLGDGNPILAIHDVGAGGLSNALPELVHDARRGARFDLRAIPSEEPGMSPLQIWCNESQERYVLALAPENLARFRELCERERCPFAVVGVATAEPHLTVADDHFANLPVDVELGMLFGKPPKMMRRVARVQREPAKFDLSDIDLREAAYRVLRIPSVADKTFLISIGDRTVGGLTARDQMVGPWQNPVADAAATLADFQGYRGEAFAIGERAPLALIDAAASARMAVGEALTNLAAAPTDRIGDIKLSANWMAAAGHPGEDAALYDAVHAIGIELCPQLGISIPVGKDSLSMKTTWRDGDRAKAVIAPLSLVISAFAPISDVRKVLTPQWRIDIESSVLLLADLGAGRNRLGGSALAQSYRSLGNVAPDIDDPARLKAFLEVIQHLNGADKILAYHDRSDGGLFVTLCEMAFATHSGVTINLDSVCYQESFGDVDGAEIRYDAFKGVHDARVIGALFAEELGAVLQIRKSDLREVMQTFSDAGLGPMTHVIGAPDKNNEHEDQLRIVRNGKAILSESRIALQRAWSETTFRMQMLRDNPACAQQEYDRILDAGDPGLHADLSFEPAEDIAASYISEAGHSARPRIAVLREQGVNGHTEMAAAFDRAGFAAVDVHMSDLSAGRMSLRDFHGFAACGGFSYGDVLGAGEGWAKSCLFNARARDEFEAFFQRADTFALGICNGCQMMSSLRDVIPGAALWPRFVRNRSEQFEARFVMVEVQPSPSLFFDGMAGSRLPIVVSHGEGYAEFADPGQLQAVQALVTLRYIDNHGAVTENYPANPNGSPFGITGMTTPDGRFTVLMPHPERAFRSVQNSWHPKAWGEEGAWLRLFRNARKWLG